MVKRQIHTILCIFLFSLSGCIFSPRNSLNTDLSQTYATYTDLPATPIVKQPQELTTEKPPLELSLDEAVQFAMHNNYALQARLEELGIAQSAVTQASRFTNPTTDIEVKSPSNSSQRNVEFNTLFTASDIWNVPLQTQVSRHEYEAIRHMLVAEVLDTIQATKHAYIHCLYAEQDLDLTNRIYTEVQQLRDRIHKRYEFGYSNDLDLSFANIMAERWYIEYTKAQTTRDNAYAKLDHILGIRPRQYTYKLTQTFTIDNLSIPQYEHVQEYAYFNRPEIQAYEAYLNQYQSQKRFEQANVFPEVAVGVSFEKELSGEHLRGPALSFDIPFFDANQAHISQAEFLYRKTQKELKNLYLTIDTELAPRINTLHMLADAIDRFNTTIQKEIAHGTEYAEHYGKKKRLNMVTVLQTRISFYETEREHLARVRDAWLTISDLERIAGKDLRTHIISNT